MAEEQHEWLDEDAAERLLRGEPVDPVDGQARTEAERLAAALGAVARSARPATGELPGEAAALAAFRGVPRAGRAGERAALPTPGRPTGHVAQSSGPEQRENPGPSDRAEHLQLPEPQGQSGPSGHPELSQALGPIRIGPAPSTTASSSAASGGRTRTPRWSRPVRFGLVASLAGCALGGVAVAAGTGMLLGPFGGHANPLPGSSVSAPASPRSGSTPTGHPPRRPGPRSRIPPGTRPARPPPPVTEPARPTARAARAGSAGTAGTAVTPTATGTPPGKAAVSRTGPAAQPAASRTARTASGANGPSGPAATTAPAASTPTVGAASKCWPRAPAASTGSAGVSCRRWTARAAMRSKAVATSRRARTADPAGARATSPRPRSRRSGPSPPFTRRRPTGSGPPPGPLRSPAEPRRPVRCHGV